MLEAVIEELKQQKQSGVASVYLEASTIAGMKEALKPLQAEPDIVSSLAESMLPVSEPVAAPRQKWKSASLPKSEIKIELGNAGSPSGTPASAVSPRSKHVTAPIPEPPLVELPAGDKHAQWAWLKDRVLGCPVCNEHVKKERGKKVVFGVGNLDADIFFCGEAPGAEEEQRGEPFVGPAGQLLTKIIGAMGLSREQVYIGNIMNWRPEMPTSYGNRKPYPEEMNFCLPYLKAQLAIVRPKVIVALGGTAVDGLLGPDPKRRMGQVRGKWQSFDETPMMITFHPSYLLRNNTTRTKRMVWEDMMLVMEKLNLAISDKQRGYFL